MCHYDQILWSCGFWRWEKFRQRCPAETRTGETCGMKLVFETQYRDTSCPLCQNIAKKERRLSKMITDINRWRKEGNKPATVDKTSQEYCHVYTEWLSMILDHNTKTNPALDKPLMVPSPLHKMPEPQELQIYFPWKVPSV